jgi:CubicO group peptidase (beta-lactamase class C family)
MPTRRHTLKLLAAGAGAPIVDRLSAGEKTTANPHAAAFMERFKVPGLSYAITREGKFIAREAYGWADFKEKRQLTTDHSFRIASVSKPLTAVAIFLLVERGKLKLDQHVFGKGGALGGMAGPAGITIHHLLTHTCGGWKNNGKDPMFKHPDYACGWLVNEAGNWWHNGSLPGLSSLLVRTSKGHCWAACANTRADGIGLALDRLMWKIVRGS